MGEVNVRELRNHGSEVLDRVARGETLTVTRGGVPVAELRPVPRARLNAAALIERWRRLPRVEATRLREDLDAIVDPAL